MNEDQDASGIMFGDMRTEDEKLTYALELALNEISKADRGGAGDEVSVADT